MKNIVFILALFLAISCQNDTSKTKTPETVQPQMEFASFGEKISKDNPLTEAEMFEKYKSLKPGDTLELKFTSKVNNVCQKKGCWMTLNLDEENEAMVRFKDYGFFMPFNASDRKAIVHGKAFIEEISVAELKHYAEDEGQTPEEIAKITKPEITYSFESDGVLLEK